MTRFDTVIPAPCRTHAPPAERRSQAVPMPRDPVARAVHFMVLDELITSRRSTAEVNASLELHGVTR